MNILYIHGFGSAFDPESDKVQALKSLGPVYGVNLDYTQSFDLNRQLVADAIQEFQIDLLVGTSMGGYLASHCAAGLPVVAINPVIDPAQSLQRHLGEHVDHAGRPFRLELDQIQYLPKFSTATGAGLILLDQGDKIIDPEATMAALRDYYQVEMWPGGHHRFAHIEQALGKISDFFFICGLVHGTVTE